MTVEQEIDILIQYGEADMSKRLHLFLQFPDLRRGFQEIERKALAAQAGHRPLCEEHNEGKSSRKAAITSISNKSIILRSIRVFTWVGHKIKSLFSKKWVSYLVTRSDYF